MATRSDAGGFGAFFRRYTKTWMHAVAAAGLTAFGVLATVHRGFVVLAIASYVVPPIVLYLSRTRGRDEPRDAASRSPTDAALAEAGRSDTNADPDSGTDRTDAAATPRSNAESVDSRTRPTAGDEVDRANSLGEDRTTDSDADRTSAETDRTPDSDADRATRTDERSTALATGEASGRNETSGTREQPDPGANRDGDTGSDPDDETDREPHWRPADTPTDATLFDAAVADGTAVAAGAGGVVLASADDEWERVLADGPGAQGQDLRAIDATADGEIVWVAGDGGAVGRIEVGTGRHTDYSAPDDRTDNLTDLAVAGPTDDETILLSNGSGEVIRGRYRDGDLAWEGSVTPGSGSSVSGVALLDAEFGCCCDTNDGVFRTDDGGRTFQTIGLDGADGTLTDVAAGDRGRCYVTTDSGVVHRFDGETWTPERVGDGTLVALAHEDGRFAATDDAGGVYERSDPTADWERTPTGASGTLNGVAIGRDRSIAVGDDGTAVERR